MTRQARAWSTLGLAAALLAVSGCGGDEGDDASDPADAAPEPPPSTAECELSERPGPIPQPPETLVADFGPPIRLPFAEPCPEDAVEVAPDGNRIYYYYAVNDSDLLVAQGRHLEGIEVRFRDRAAGDTWGPPRVLDLRRALPDSVPGETRVAPDGSWVVWHAISNDNYGYVDGLPAGQSYDLDLYRAPLENAVPGPATHLQRGINGAYLDGEHWVSADGGTIYVSSTRPGGPGGVDIWRVTRDAGGAWGSPELLPAPINSSATDMQPTLSPDGAWFYFVSERQGPVEIWRVAVLPDGSFGSAAERVLSPFVGEPSFADDGRLFFVHVEVDFSGSTPDIYDSDIYYVEPTTP